MLFEFQSEFVEKIISALSAQKALVLLSHKRSKFFSVLRVKANQIVFRTLREKLFFSSALGAKATTIFSALRAKANSSVKKVRVFRSKVIDVVVFLKCFES